MKKRKMLLLYYFAIGYLDIFEEKCTVPIGSRPMVEGSFRQARYTHSRLWVLCSPSKFFISALFMCDTFLRAPLSFLLTTTTTTTTTRRIVRRQTNK
jgi:hypothetical protein